MGSRIISPENKIAFLERVSKNAPIRSSLKLELSRGLEMNITVAIGSPCATKQLDFELPEPGSVEVPYCS